mmetsp:Transcript_1387/g.2999  ORF Transcript_1387/g.2999 Transcript_1387/m.2999 type:complete len:87 (-) Transcript_1387:235-495(-)
MQKPGSSLIAAISYMDVMPAQIDSRLGAASSFVTPSLARLGPIPIGMPKEGRVELPGVERLPVRADGIHFEPVPVHLLLDLGPPRA